MSLEAEQAQLVARVAAVAAVHEEKGRLEAQVRLLQAEAVRPTFLLFLCPPLLLSAVFLLSAGGRRRRRIRREEEGRREGRC